MIQLKTLVLSQNYLPLSVFPLYTIPAEEALVRHLKGTGTVVEWYDRKVLTPSNHDLYWPSVIVNHTTKFSKSNVPFNKESVLLRDKGKCQYCSKELSRNTMTYDHVIPRRDNGKHCWENVTSSCSPCNLKKGHDTKGWVPKIKPYKPTYFELMNLRKKSPLTIHHDSWRPYISDFENLILAGK